MQTLTFLFAFIAVLALIGVAAWLVRRFANNRLGANTQRGRMPRLAVIDAAAVDGRRRLVLVRRDNVEHLLMIGGPSDIVVEPNIVRAMPNRDQMAPRPAVGEQPPRIAPLPDTAWSDEAARSDLRSTDAFEHAEPQMPEPPPRPARPSFADDLRRPAPPPMPERRSDPLTGFAPESISGRPEPAPPRLTRNEPLIPRPQRELPKVPREAPPVREAPPIREAASVRDVPPVREAPVARETPVRAPERAAAPPPPPAPAPSSADQNLAEMAQRLEAALRRPAEPVAPPVAPETPPAPRNSNSRSESPAPTPPAPAPQKSGFENLEDEMASLLGRPKNPS
ncbi:flagellar biosynthetic protein FliO [Bradyrhizobium australiense]|uniref:Flagellar biosynthesis protein FliO n=1 Tax=Bradyrhizobium australiense TaxID=2721161 RepID=A0A7Y4LWC6_9BRAD|nr:flagellar biosynthetic protein FliO [Bradyrhizobium australiense]NOJ41327.1 flagellar biosynthesis protein FliO [Bradyrhizobium australiense]